MITAPVSTSKQIISLAGLVPNPDALLLLQPHEAYAWKVLPLGWEKEKLVVATPQPLEPLQLSMLRLRTRWSIIQRVCSEIELKIALDKYYGKPSQPRNTLRSIDPLALLRALDIVPNEVVRLALGQQVYNRDASDSWLDWLQHQGEISVEQVTLLRAAQHNRPYLRVTRFSSPPGLAVIVPALLAARWNAVPFYADAHRVWVYTPGDSPLLNPDELSRTVGLEVRPVFVTRTQWDIAFIRLYKGAQSQSGPAHTVDHILTNEDWLSASQKAQAREVTRRTGTPISALARGKGWLAEQDWHKVEARRWGLIPGYEAKPGDTATLQGLSFTIDLCKHWGVVPLALRENDLHIGLSQTAQSQLISAVSAITKHPVHAHLLTKEQYKRAWSLYFEQDRNIVSPVPTLDEWLLAGVYTTADQMEKALEHGQAEKKQLDESLLALGLVSTTDLAEVLSLQSDLPWFPLENPPRPLSLEQRVALPAEQRVALPAEQRVALPAEQRVALPAEQRVALPAEQRVALPAEQRVALPAEQRARLGMARTVVPLVDLGRSPDGVKSVLVAVSDPYELSGQNKGDPEDEGQRPEGEGEF